jgi:hypothetical protein
VFDDKWEVIVRDLPQNEFKTFTFDCVLVCNGFSAPLIPKIEGQDVLKAKQMHSHDYRKPEDLEGEKVLVIGEFQMKFPLNEVSRVFVNRRWSIGHRNHSSDRQSSEISHLVEPRKENLRPRFDDQTA